MNNWKKDGARAFKAITSDYNAFIFGAANHWQMWAWAVYGYQFMAEGCESSLKAARARANAKIAEIVKKQGGKQC